MSVEQSRQTIQWLADRLMTHIPPTIDGDSHWGDTKSVWAGVKIRRDGLKLSTKRRRRELRHGRWIRYQIQLPVANQTGKPRSAVPATIHSLTPVIATDGSVGRWGVDSTIKTPAKFDVRVERWNLGVQWFSVQITGDMTLELDTKTRIGAQPDYSEVPPAIALVADVDNATLRVPYFEVNRISKLGGDVAEELGDLAEETILKLWLKSENKKLADKLNRAIEKNRDDMRWSMMDWFTNWQQTATRHIP